MTVVASGETLMVIAIETWKALGCMLLRLELLLGWIALSRLVDNCIA